MKLNYLSLFLILFFSIFQFTEQIGVSKSPWPDKYHLELTLSIPGSSINQPITCDYDLSSNKVRIDQYHGLSVNLFRYDQDPKYYYEMVVAQTQQICFKNHSNLYSNTIPVFLPDYSKWTKLDPEVRRGVRVNAYQLTTKKHDTETIYTFYINTENNHPVQYTVKGVLDIFAQHFDEYIINYYIYIPDRVDDSVFDLPKICAESDQYSYNHVFGRNLFNFKKLFPSPIKEESEFDKFLEKYSKNYAGEEYFKRKQIFERNLNKINQHNKKKSTYTLAVNKFADLTFEEVESIYLLPKRDVPISKQSALNFNSEKLMPNDQLPHHFNWLNYGAVTSVKDQGTCSSSWAFAAAGTLEGQYFLATSNLESVSAQNIIDCSWESEYPSYGCDGSSHWKALNSVKEMGGFMNKNDYPYLSVSGYCAFDKSQSLSTIDKIVNITSSDYEVAQSLYEYGPMSISLHVIESLLFYSGGLYNDVMCSQENVNYAALLIGYGFWEEDPTQAYWLIKSSWGDTWGDEGYLYIARDNNLCGVCSEVSYVVLGDISSIDN
ncbi:hypothetical protein M0812_04599 [Anaeramoeba flamelloides]|uniref:Uncharacterized protein n=1 Tax=Anaeramoeba flamelloides TaxID=1746091 RepID=A0AAV8AJ84_9EUKA|nr:hypothetical protein M0812_04599 [Anaeramoeba flamelloides]